MSNDLSKQSGVNRNLVTENEKLQDKVKLIEEKLNHTERDNLQKKQLIEFYKKKLEDSGPNFSIENETILNDCKQQLKKSNELNEKLKVELKSTKTRIQTVLQEKQAANESLEKVMLELNGLKKEKLPRLESSLKQAKSKISELESYIENMGNKSEDRLKSLAETSQQTVDLAQVRLKYAYKVVESYEKTMKSIYTNLITRLNEVKKEVYEEKLKNMQRDHRRIKQANIDENMKNALDLASSVLNLTHDELDDILSPKKMDNNNDLPVITNENHILVDSDKLLFEFEQHLNASKKERKFMGSINSDFSSDNQNQTIVNLVSNRLNEVFGFERELAYLKANQKLIC